LKLAVVIVLHSVAGVSREARGAPEPLIECPWASFRAVFEGMVGGFVEGDAVADDIGKEGAAVGPGSGLSW